MPAGFEKRDIRRREKFTGAWISNDVSPGVIGDDLHDGTRTQDVQARGIVPNGNSLPYGPRRDEERLALLIRAAQSSA